MERFGDQTSAALVGDRYELGEELGRGAFGVVYKGVDVKNGDVVAIKRISLSGMSQDRLQSIMLEIDLLKNLQHDNIVTYIGSCKTRSHLDIILEYMEQGALSQLIKKDRWGVLPEHMIAAFISQVLHGLSYLHGQGVVHRDIKGANILLGAAGQVKLADFGVATRGEEKGASEIFDPVGTPYWMAPEVIELTGSTAPSDIWSVACLIIELYTGSPPYFDLQPMSALYRIVQDAEVPLPRGLSPELQAFLGRCFAKDPQDRPTASELLQDKWLLTSTRTLRMSWSRSGGLASRGSKPRDAHQTIRSVVERILEHSGTAAASATSPAPARRSSGPLQTSVARMTEPARGSHERARPPLPVAPALAARDARSEARTPEASGELPTSLPPPDVRSAASTVERTADAAAPSHVDAEGDAQGGGPSRVASSSRPSGAERLEAVLCDLRRAPCSGALLDASGASPATTAGRAASPAAAPSFAVARRRDTAHSVASSDMGHAAAVAACAGLALGVRPPSPSGSGAAETAGSADFDEARQELQELRGHVAVLHNMQQRETVASIAAACQAIQRIVAAKPLAKQWFLEEAGIITVMEMLQQKDVIVLQSALDLLTSVAAGDDAVLESLTLVGVVPLVAALTAARHVGAVRRRAAAFVQLLCATSAHTVQIFVACGGVAVLVGLLDADVASEAHLIPIALDAIWSVLQSASVTPVNHYCRLLAQADLVTQLLRAVAALVGLTKQRPPAGPDAAAAAAQGRAYLEAACDLLVVMANADSVVKAHVSQPRNLAALLGLMQELPGELLSKLLGAVRTLTTDPQVLRQMQEARAVPMLVGVLRQGETESGVEVTLPRQLLLLQALHNLCKVSKERQLEAASAHVTPVLLSLVERTNQRGAAARRRSLGPSTDADADVSTSIRALCIVLLCVLAHSNAKTRNELWAHQGLDLFINLLGEPEWRRQALDALSVWLVEDTQRLEPKLLVKRNIAIVVNMFRDANKSEERLLAAFKEMLTCSPKLCVQFGSQSDLPAIMLGKLSSANAFLTSCILGVIQTLYDSHPRPKEFILKYQLMRNLQSVRKRHGDAIKVLDKTEVLMKAIQVNSVL